MKRDICYLYSDDVLDAVYKKDKKGLYINKIKNFILKAFPFLLGIKPNAYAVLTAKTDREISIF